ncbi:MAG: alpha/beta hydrolase [Lachnospiraceae bacterium]|nr:alpha/beta hydrolase [Lachnospiraceae bacterium]
MFDESNTIRDLLEDKLVADYLDLVYPKSFVELVPEEYRDVPLKKLPEYVKMPWGVPYISRAVLEAVGRLYELNNDENIDCIPLWKDCRTAQKLTKPSNTKETACLFLYKDTFKDNRPVALIVPGGAYSSVSVAGEGMDTADALREKGYAVAILRYRCRPGYYPKPQQDLALAVKYIRANAEELHTDGGDLLVIGFSAGGHLAASETVYAPMIESGLMNELKAGSPGLYDRYLGVSAKADKIALAYAFTGGAESADCFVNHVGSHTERIDDLIVFHHINSDFPKCFIWACEDDPVVDISNSTEMAHALEKNGVPCRLRLYPNGGHGRGTAKGTAAEGWLEEMLRFFSR